MMRRRRCRTNDLQGLHTASVATYSENSDL
jgi:hypothetical protein